MNEREYLQQLSRSTPEEIAAEILHADEEHARVLEIYFGAEQYGRLQSIAQQGLARGGTPAPKRGNVVVLHGIMGSDLAEYGVGSPTLIWVQVLKLIGGAFSRLALDDEGNSTNDIRSSGIYLRYYGSLMVSLNQEWNVRPFFYDWRRDIRFAAADLNTMLTSQFPNQPVHLVAHSMGGLVARAFIAKFPDTWNTAAKDGARGNLIMLGTPNYGSFAIPRLLLGTNDVLNLVAKIDLSHSPRQLLETAKTFTGAYQMLPAKGHIDGLDALYKSATYNVATIPQSLLDGALTFQKEIASVIDKNRMAYVAGYNRVTPAAIKDVTQLANDTGYVLSKRGDGTVPHDLGLLPDVRTFYIDEEHMKLPANLKVQAALTELLTTCNQSDERYLWKGLGPEFANQRGADGDDQPILMAAQASRRAVKEQQADALRNVILSRGDLQADTVSAEQQALADLLMQHDLLRLSIAGHPVGSDMPTDSTSAPAQPAAVTATVAPPESRTVTIPQAATEIRVRVLLKSIAEIAPNDTSDARPIDCIAVGHYLRVRPTGAERDLDIAISGQLRPASSGQEPILTAFHDRGVLRGDLGVPYFLPDPRPGHEKVLIAVAGMGPTGEFGDPELSLLARELCWSAAQLGKKHLATVLIGASIRNLSFADAIHAWLLGINRALANGAASDSPRIEAVTFVIKDKYAPLVVSALNREAQDPNDPSALSHLMTIKLVDLPAVKAPERIAVEKAGSTHISIDFDPAGIYRYSAMTASATIPERVIKVDPRRLKDVSTRLLITGDKMERYKLGRFLLDFLFPRDLRAQLTGSAPVVLQLNNEAAKVYWEVAAQPLGDNDPTLVACDMPYLGLQRGLTRQLRTILAPPPEPPPPFGRTLRILIVADGNAEARLPGAQKEAQTLMALFDRVNKAGTGNQIAYTALVGPSKATTLDVLLRISDQPPFDVLHYAGHCVYDTQNPERSGLLFSGGDRLTAADLNQVDRTPKFVFANACQSGILPSRPDLSSPELPAAFAEAFFQKGVANFICTAWPVEDAAASDFAEELYRNLLGDGVPVVQMYEALRAARRKIADTMTWGAYQHYGDPYFRLLHGTTQDDGQSISPE
jgi:pimeloyl-ACP methyl ester carboxylesterase